MSEFDDLMRKALRDPQLWREVTAQEAAAERVFEWVSDAKAQTTAELARRKAEWAEVAACNPVGSGAYRAALAEYSEWRKRALGFLAIVGQRKSDLKAAHRTTRLTRAMADRGRFNDLLLFLADQIARHESGDISDADLYGTLDTLTVPHGLGAEATLRDVLAARCTA